MRKSRVISISLVSGFAGAALAAGCGSPAPPQTQGWQTCVDRASSAAVDRRNCEDERSVTHPATYTPHYNWYYYPRGYYWDAPSIGTRVPEGGTFNARPFAAVPMARSGGIVRGGFGSTGAGHGSGGE